MSHFKVELYVTVFDKFHHSLSHIVLFVLHKKLQQSVFVGRVSQCFQQVALKESGRELLSLFSGEEGRVGESRGEVGGNE